MGITPGPLKNKRPDYQRKRNNRHIKLLTANTDTELWQRLQQPPTDAITAENTLQEGASFVDQDNGASGLWARKASHGSNAAPDADGTAQKAE